MIENLTMCKASQKMLKKAKDEGISTIFERSSLMKPCPFGEQGICCKYCMMGPCRISEKIKRGVCGATSETIVARNLGRMIAAGTSAHSDHAREIVNVLLLTARGEVSGFEIKDEKRLHDVATIFGVKTEGRKKEEIAEDVGKIAFSQFTQQEGELIFIKRHQKRG